MKDDRQAFANGKIGLPKLLPLGVLCLVVNKYYEFRDGLPPLVYWLDVWCFTVTASTVRLLYGDKQRLLNYHDSVCFLISILRFGFLINGTPEFIVLLQTVFIALATLHGYDLS